MVKSLRPLLLNKALLALVLLVCCATSSRALNFQNLCSIPNPPSSPLYGLTLGPDGNYYGIAAGGSTNGHGVAFRMSPAGEFTTLKILSTNFGTSHSPLVLAADNKLYGYSQFTDSPSQGVIYRISTNGSAEVVKSFSASATLFGPSALTTSFDQNLYGVGVVRTNQHVKQAVFRLTTNGVIRTVAVIRAAISSHNDITEGADGNLYVTTPEGGDAGLGLIQKVTKNGSVSTFFMFNGTNTTASISTGGLIVGTNGAFYGSTTQGGDSNGGTIFKLTTNGVFTILASLPDSIEGHPRQPMVVAVDGTLYLQAGYTIYRVVNDAVDIFHVFDANDHSKLNGPVGLTATPDGHLLNANEYGGTENVGVVTELDSNGNLLNAYSFSHGWDPLRYEFAPNGDGTLIGVALTGTHTWLGENDTTEYFQLTTNGLITTSARIADFIATSALTKADDGKFYGLSRGSNYVTVCYQLNDSYQPNTVAQINDPVSPSAFVTDALTKGMDGRLYGGMSDYNSSFVFAVSTNGPVETLATFTNNVQLNSHLVQGGDSFWYGTSFVGGTADDGEVYKTSGDGNHTTVVTFTGTNGANPHAGLIVGTDGNLYGTTAMGGKKNKGTVFAITPSGQFKTLFSFAGTNGSWPNQIIQADNGKLYGTTKLGGRYSFGTVFELSTNGVFRLLNSFALADGGYPVAPLARGDDGSLYGSTQVGGNGRGTIFRVGPVAPTITVQPLSHTNALKSSVTFSVTATGPSPYTYQWLKDGTPLAKKTGRTLSLTNLQYSAAGNYSVIVSNADGFTISSNAVLTIAPPPMIISQPESQTVTVDNVATFSVSASSMLKLSYQWQFKGVAMTGKTQSTLTINNVQTKNAGNYRVIVKNGSGSVTSSNAFLTVQTCSYTLSTNVVFVGSDGGSAGVSIEANHDDCQWLVANTNSWITLTVPTANTGSQLLTFNVAANTNSAGRVGSIIVAGTSIVVSQAGTFAAGAVNGKTFSFHLDSGAGSSFRLITSLVASNFIRIPATTAPTNYVYVKGSANSATLTLANAGVYQLTYDSPSTGSYVYISTNNNVGAGTFSVLDSKPDYNGDGGADLLSQNIDGSLRVSMMMRTNFLGDLFLQQVADSSWTVVGQADFDGDGNVDQLMQNSSGFVRIYYMKGTNFTALATLNGGNAVDTAWKIVGVHDFDGDGHPDILWQHTSGSLWLWLMNNAFISSSFVLRNGASPGSAWHVVAIADFNHDGQSDILFRTDGGLTLVWFMSGATFIASQQMFDGQALASGWHVVGVNDFDYDGQADVLLQNNTNGTLLVWLMDGITRTSSFILNASAPDSRWNIVGPK